MNSEPFSKFADPSGCPWGVEYAEMIKEEVRSNSSSVKSREDFLTMARKANLRLDIIGKENCLEYRNNVFGGRRYMVGSHQWPAAATASDDNNICKYELIGFPNYQAPTELARLMFVVTETEWTDTIFVTSMADFKIFQAGTPLMPTGCLPMFIDHSAPSLGRITEYLGVFPCVAMNLRLMGTTEAEWMQNFFWYMMPDNSFDFCYGACVYEAEKLLEIPAEHTFPVNFTKYFIPSLEDQTLLLTPERINKLKVWLSETFTTHKNLQHVENYLSERQRSKQKFLFGDNVSMADIVLFLDMLRLYGRQIFREALPDFPQRFPHLVCHFKTILCEFPHLVDYLQDPSRHYKAAYAYLNQCEALCSYGNLFDGIDNDDKDQDIISGNNCKAEVVNDNPIARALEAIKVTFASGMGLQRVTVDEKTLSERPRMVNFLKMLGVEAVVPPHRTDTPGCCNLNAMIELLPESEVEKFMMIFVASANGALGTTTAARSKNLQIFSVVIYLLNTFESEGKEFFKKEVLDRNRAGAFYSNASPGNAQYLEMLIQMNGIDGKDGVVCRSRSNDNNEMMSLADVGIYVFVKTVLEDKEIMQCEDDERAFQEEFPLLMKVYGLLKSQRNL